jgi:hypothetical protein
MTFQPKPSSKKKISKVSVKQQKEQEKIDYTGVFDNSFDRTTDDRFFNIWYEDETFLVSDDGIFEHIMTKKGPALKRIADYPLIPYSYYRVVDTSSSKEFYTGIEFLNFALELDRLKLPISNKFQSKELKDVYSLPATQNSVKDLDRYFSHVDKKLKRQNKLKEEFGYKKTGYIFDDEGKIFDYVNLGHPNYLLNYKIPERKGTYEGWLNTFKKMCLLNPINAFLAACAVSSYCKAIIKGSIYNPLVNLHSDPNRGKSTFLRALVSIENKPDKGFKYVDASGTAFSLQKLMALNNDSFMCMDELDKKSKSKWDVQKMVVEMLHLLNGGDKSRGTITGGFETGENVSEFIFTCSNDEIKSMELGSVAEKALYSRMLELKYDDKATFNLVDINSSAFDLTNDDTTTIKEIDNLDTAYDYYVEKSDDFLEELSENYGWAVDVIVDYVKNNHNDLRAEYFTNRDNIRNMSAAFKTDARKVQLLAFISLGIKILDHIDPEIAQTAQRVLDKEIEDSKQLKESKTNSEVDIYIHFKELLYLQAGKFVYKGGMYSSNSSSIYEQKENAIRLTDKAQTSFVYGTITNDKNHLMDSETDFNGKVDLLAFGVEKLCEEMRISQSEFISSMKRIGVLVSNTDNGKRKLSKNEQEAFKKFKNSNTRVITISLLSDVETHKLVDMFDSNEEEINIKELNTSSEVDKTDNDDFFEEIKNRFGPINPKSIKRNVSFPDETFEDFDPDEKLPPYASDDLENPFGNG